MPDHKTEEAEPEFTERFRSLPSQMKLSRLKLGAFCLQGRKDPAAAVCRSPSGISPAFSGPQRLDGRMAARDVTEPGWGWIAAVPALMAGTQRPLCAPDKYCMVLMSQQPDELGIHPVLRLSSEEAALQLLGWSKTAHCLEICKPGKESK